MDQKIWKKCLTEIFDQKILKKIERKIFHRAKSPAILPQNFRQFFFTNFCSKYFLKSFFPILSSKTFPSIFFENYHISNIPVAVFIVQHNEEIRVEEEFRAIPFDQWSIWLDLFFLFSTKPFCSLSLTHPLYFLFLLLSSSSIRKLIFLLFPNRDLRKVSPKRSRGGDQLT